MLGLLEGKATPRKTLFGYYGDPGTRLFKIMAREGNWKYIWLSNGGQRTVVRSGKRPIGAYEPGGNAIGKTRAD